jgi:Fe-S-cluster containining protein
LDFSPHASNLALPPSRRLPDGGTVNPSEKLCLACGLCCDGTLFDLVKLEGGDDAAKLKALGLPVTVSRGKTPIARFPQPCSALCEDRTCRVYADRPWQCRVFECGVLKNAKAGRVTFAAALRLVQKSRRLADKVRRLLRELGDTEEHRALGERFHRMSDRLEFGKTDADANAKFADLSLAMHHLKLQALNKFYTKTEAKESASAGRAD